MQGPKSPRAAWVACVLCGQATQRLLNGVCSRTPAPRATPQVYHPNLDLEGKICLNILREDWKPVLSISSVIYGLQFLFLVRAAPRFLAPPAPQPCARPGPCAPPHKPALCACADAPQCAASA